MRLLVNIDHIATLRQVRLAHEPDPVIAASVCIGAGADGIVAHLREDRRHIQDRDIELLRKTVTSKFDLEMAATDEIVGIALAIHPDLVTLVPEKRMELTTEGGLDVPAQKKRLTEVIQKFRSARIPVSLFVEPERDIIAASKEVGADFVELHTGTYAESIHPSKTEHELNRLRSAAEYAFSIGLGVNAGHGLNYHNVGAVAAIRSIEEMSIGHSIIARAALVGLDRAVRDMIDVVRSARTSSQ